MGPSAFKVLVQTVISQHRRRQTIFRIKLSSVNKLEAFLCTIVSQGWINTPIGRIAQSTTFNEFVEEFRRPQVGMYINNYSLQWKKDVFCQKRYCFIRFSHNSFVKVNNVFFDIGAIIGLWSAAALRSPGVQIFSD